MLIYFLEIYNYEITRNNTNLIDFFRVVSWFHFLGIKFETLPIAFHFFTVFCSSIISEIDLISFCLKVFGVSTSVA